MVSPSDDGVHLWLGGVYSSGEEHRRCTAHLGDNRQRRSACGELICMGDDEYHCCMEHRLVGLRHGRLLGHRALAGFVSGAGTPYLTSHPRAVCG